ncbi:MAG TPA: DegT/DnrJ/EryC1/StrS family aminotransferase [Candidatus Krumholzibacteria bacterium]|nr:DegT/DnrJ/EryC1/StrS family aminotransferase [Candidatus Krumholzibacteria bacterium]
MPTLVETVVCPNEGPSIAATPPAAVPAPQGAVTTRRLAIQGGEPAFPRPIHVGAPNIGDKERLLRRIEAALDGRRLSNNGPFVRLFEKRIEDLTGVAHCVAMCNGTVALEIGARALGLTGEVIVPAFTFVATAHALAWQGITPVFGDIDPQTHCLDPERIAELVTPRTTGILAVHLWGRPAPADRLQEVAREHGLKLMFDAAHAFGCSRGGRMVGNFGDLEVFSFHATKFLNTAEGGAVVTNDPQLAERVRLMHNFGFTGLDRVEALGVNGKMNELSAAVGLTSLEHMDEWITVNRVNRALWAEALAPLPGVTLRHWGEGDRRNDQYVVCEVDQERAGISRDGLVEALRAENVLARRYFHPGCHRMEPYRSQPPAGGWNLPHTERAAARVMVLPTGTAVTAGDIARIGELMAEIMTRGDEVSSLAARRLAREENR